MGKYQSWRFKQGTHLVAAQMRQLLDMGISIVDNKKDYETCLDGEDLPSVVWLNEGIVIDSQVDATGIGWKENFTKAFAELLIEYCACCGQRIGS